MIMWVVLLLVPTVWAIVFRYRRRHMYKLASMITGPAEEIPIIGIAHMLKGNTEDIMTGLQRLSYITNSDRCKGVSKCWLGHILYFVMTDPADVEFVLKTCLEKDDLHRFIRVIIGYGGIFAPVQIWRRRRKILVPAFSPKIVETFVNVFSEQSEKLAKQLTKSVDKGYFSVWPYISTYTLDSVFETALGCKINAQENPNSTFLKSMNRVLNIVTERIFHIWLQPQWLFNLFPSFEVQEECLRELHSFTDDIITKRRKTLKEEQKELDKQPEADRLTLEQYNKNTFLDLLIKISGKENGYTDLELREEVLTLTIAGTDTSATAIGFVLQLLSKYPEIQERCYEEVMEVFGDSDRPLVKEDLPNLKFLERVVKESLRLFPPVPFIIRKVLEDTTLPSGRTIPRGSGIPISIWGIHRDPRYWGPNAEHFDPDRFLPERFKLAHACSFMPFSNGPRNCLGYAYALMSIKSALANILRHYIIKGEKENGPIPKIRVKIDVMLKSVDDYQIALEKRKPR